jgi:hypothetical protein
MPNQDQVLLAPDFDCGLFGPLIVIQFSMLFADYLEGMVPLNRQGGDGRASPVAPPVGL